MSGAWKKNKPRTTSMLDGKEDEFRRIHATKTDTELAKYFNVATISISRWRKKLGLTKERVFNGSPHFNESKDDFITIHDDHSDGDLSDIFEISIGTVEQWRAKLGLKKDPKKRWERQPHPRGYKGYTHSEETRKKLGVKSKKYWDSLSPDQKDALIEVRCMQAAKNKTISNNRKKCSWKSGWREIKGKRYYFRSRWEFNYALYLEFLKEKEFILDWEFEPDTFWFEKIKRGVRSYLPDFKIHGKHGVVYHEVKGWMDDRSKTKLKRMAKYYPDVKLVVIAAKQYNEIKKNMSGILKGWEF